jgi:ankyrin repeat protein
MTTPTLYEAVKQLAAATHALSDADLEQPWRWRAHEEGVRFALLGTYHELRDLAVTLAHRRAQEGPPLALAQRVLAPYHEAYRELQALLLGVPTVRYEEPPAPGEWHLRDILTHMINTERTFFTLVHYGLARQRTSEELSPRLPDGEVQRVVDSSEEFAAVWRDGSPGDLLDYYERLHERALREFSQITDEELQGPSVWWEEQELSLQYRLHRFDAHLRQHTVQVETTLEAVGQENGDARRLLRLVYRALAQVEGALLGAGELGQTRRQALARQIIARAADVEATLEQARRLVQAAQEGNIDAVKQLLKANPALAQCVDDGALPVLMSALYRGHEEVATTLAGACEELDVFAAAALGRLDEVEARVVEWPGYVNEVARDGFTPLQLACYFGREKTALWLIEHGADVEAVAQNAQQIRPIHAAAANGNLVVLRALLAHGADVNASQQQDFTPLHTAADRGDGEMARLFLGHGADVEARDALGRTAAELAQERGHEGLATLLAGPVDTQPSSAPP